jgi:hypothetical protein
MKLYFLYHLSVFSKLQILPAVCFVELRVESVEEHLNRSASFPYRIVAHFLQECQADYF